MSSRDNSSAVFCDVLDEATVGTLFGIWIGQSECAYAWIPSKATLQHFAVAMTCGIVVEQFAATILTKQV
jgi:hypothetical protein